MILAYRIVRSEAWKTHGRDRVRLILSEEGMEDPKTNAVVLDTDDLRGMTLGPTWNMAFPPTGERPKVLVNGVEMFLEVFQREPTYEAQVNAHQQAGAMWMVMHGMTTSKSKMAKAAQAFASFVETGAEIRMVVSWE